MHARVSMHMPYLPHPHERKCGFLRHPRLAQCRQLCLRNAAWLSLSFAVSRRSLSLSASHAPTFIHNQNKHAVGNKCHGTIKHHLPPSYDRLPSLLRSIFSLPVFICPVYRRALHDSRLGSTRIHVWHEYIVCTLYACHIYYRSYSISRDYRFGFSFKTQSGVAPGNERESPLACHCNDVFQLV